jgi:hypothetical protein
MSYDVHQVRDIRARCHRAVESGTCLLLRQVNRIPISGETAGVCPAQHSMSCDVAMGLKGGMKEKASRQELAGGLDRIRRSFPLWEGSPVYIYRACEPAASSRHSHRATQTLLNISPTLPFLFYTVCALVLVFS